MAPSYFEADLQRRALFGLLPDGESSSSSSASSTPTAAATTSTANGGLLGGLTSAVGDVTSAVGGVVSSLVPSSTSTSSSSSSSSSSSTSSTPASTSSSSSSSTSTSTSSSTSSTTSSSTTTSASSSSSTTSSVVSTSSPASSTATPQAVSQDETTTYISTSDNQVLTITATLEASAPTASATTGTTQAATHQSFLQNKPLSGAVFALVGIAGLVILIVISTWFVRRARKNRLERDAETFAGVFPDPDGLGSGSGGGGASANFNEKVGRTASGRTARTNASDEALIGGGYGHRRQLSDGTIDQRSQMTHNSQGGFNPLPAPPGLTGTRPQPGVPPMPAYAYESAYPTYQQAAYMSPQQQQQLQRQPTNGSMWGGQAYAPQGAAPQIPQMQHQQALQVQTQQKMSQPQPPSRIGNSSPSPTGQGSIFGAGAEPTRNSASSDAYADYAFATGPGQQGAGPRNLTIANV